MLLITSPAKTLNTTSTFVDIQPTQPEFLAKTAKLQQYMQTTDVPALMKLMHISEELAIQNVERYQVWQKEHTISNSRPSIFTFNGDVFKAMDIANYTKDQLQYAQKHLRILSGFYGYLRPLDLMQPYRLEMGTKLTGGPTNSLPTYWQPAITKHFNQDLAAHTTQCVLNLASAEYSAAVDTTILTYPIINVTFLQERSGGTKTYGILAKKARGLMIDYCIKYNVTTLKELEKFTVAGYKLINKTEHELVFLLPEQGK